MSFLWSSYPREFFLYWHVIVTLLIIILKYIALIILNAKYKTTRFCKHLFYQKNELCMVHLVFIFTLYKVRYFKLSLTVILLLSNFTNADFIYTRYSFIQTDDRKPSVSIQWAGALKCSYHSYLGVILHARTHTNSYLKLSFLSVEHILCMRRPIFPVSSSTIFPVILRILIRSLRVLPVSL